MKIISNNKVEVIKLKTVVKFNIKKNNKLWDSVKFLLKQKKNQFSVKATNIIGFNDYLKTEPFLYKHAERFFLDIKKKIKNLEESNITLSEIKLENIYYLELDNDNFMFLILNSESLIDIKNEKIEITQPLEKSSKYFSPEMKKLTKIPSEISYKSCYFSLAMIIVDSLKKIEKDLVLETHLPSLCETKLYYALERCLEENPENRYLLYI